MNNSPENSAKKTNEKLIQPKIYGPLCGASATNYKQYPVYQFTKQANQADLDSSGLLTLNPERILPLLSRPLLVWRIRIMFSATIMTKRCFDAQWRRTRPPLFPLLRYYPTEVIKRQCRIHRGMLNNRSATHCLHFLLTTQRFEQWTSRVDMLQPIRASVFPPAVSWSSYRLFSHLFIFYLLFKISIRTSFVNIFVFFCRLVRLCFSSCLVCWLCLKLHIGGLGSSCSLKTYNFRNKINTFRHKIRVWAIISDFDSWNWLSQPPTKGDSLYTPAAFRWHHQWQQ